VANRILIVPIIAMESTGVYWRPVHNILEGFMEVILVNARHIKNVPDLKTDISDSKWLAGLLTHGLLKRCFIPEKKIRQWRELTRLRRTYTESMADYKRRVHKLFEAANIKIDSVISDPPSPPFQFVPKGSS
jgi:transposase